MTIAQSLLSFVLAAGLLTIAPGLDSALVLRTAATEGGSRAARAGLGIFVGCLVWGGVVAVAARNDKRPDAQSRAVSGAD